MTLSFVCFVANLYLFFSSLFMSKYCLMFCILCGVVVGHIHAVLLQPADYLTDSAIVRPYFPFPAIPDSLTSSEERKAYLLSHYWDQFDFSDTLLVDNRNVTEQGFVDFIALLGDKTTSELLVRESLQHWCSRLVTFTYARQVLSKIADSYLYNSTSPYYNEKLYACYLVAMLRSVPENDVHRATYQFKLQLLGRNNVGAKASDFCYYLPDGEKCTLSETSAVNNRLVVVFYDPECESCHEVLRQMAMDSKLEEAVRAERVTVLAVYTEGDEETWRKSLPDMPSGWIVATDRGIVKEQALYDLKAMPSLYLLDGQKRVVPNHASHDAIRKMLD